MNRNSKNEYSKNGYERNEYGKNEYGKNEYSKNQKNSRDCSRNVKDRETSFYNQQNREQDEENEY